MSFLEDYIENNTEYLTKYCQSTSTFNYAYAYWREHLFERVMKLFVWEGTETEDKNKSIKPKEIEQRLMICGHLGVRNFSSPSHNIYNKLGVFYGTYHGVTEYQDEFTHYIVHSPIYTGDGKIGKDIVTIDNTSIRNNIMDLIHHYSIMLGHIDVSIIDATINCRETAIPIATSEKLKTSIGEWQKKRYLGQYGSITDKANLGINFVPLPDSNTDILNLYETREKLLKSFYSCIGVRSAFEKRNNTVMAEVESDTSLLQLNLSDMLKCREDGAKAVNDMFGTNWSVHLAEEIDYGKENERVEFANMEEVHTAKTEGEETLKKGVSNE